MNKLEHTSIVETYCQKLSELIQRMVQAADTAERKVLDYLQKKYGSKDLIIKRLAFFKEFFTTISSLNTEDVFINPDQLKEKATYYHKVLVALNQDGEFNRILKEGHPDDQKSSEQLKIEYPRFKLTVSKLQDLTEAIQKISNKSGTDLIEHMKDPQTFKQIRDKFIHELKALEQKLESQEMVDAIRQAQASDPKAGEKLRDLVKSFRDKKADLEQMIKTINDENTRHLVSGFLSRQGLFNAFLRMIANLDVQKISDESAELKAAAAHYSQEANELAKDTTAIELLREDHQNHSDKKEFFDKRYSQFTAFIQLLESICRAFEIIKIKQTNSSDINKLVKELEDLKNGFDKIEVKNLINNVSSSSREAGNKFDEMINKVKQNYPGNLA